MATPQIDYDAQLQGFLFQKFIQIIRDPARHREERLGMQMEFESFILSWGPRILPIVQRTVTSRLIDYEDLQLFEWFVEFVSSLGSEWLTEVNTATVALFWPSLPNSRVRRAVLELIAKTEWVTNSDRAAQNSEIVGFFRGAQPDPNSELSDRASEIAAVLSRLAACARPTQAMYQASITRFSLRVLSFCFRDANTPALNEDQVERVMRLFGRITNEQRRLFEELIRVTGDV